MVELLERTFKSTLAALDKDLENAETKIIEIVNEDEYLKCLFVIITSVVGIGYVTAINLLVYTNGFTQHIAARKLACHCGVGAFGYSSGTSICGKTKVYFMADARLSSADI